MDLQTDFTETTLRLMPDTEGENIATLVASKQNTGKRNAVLYVHGYMDYFFHPHVAAAFHQQNMDFFALDLRKYGRSLLPHQTPNYCESIAEYFEEITLAINHITQNQPANTTQKLFVLAHSTGCITACMYANLGEKKHAIHGLILNSPFLEMPQAKVLTKAMYRAGKLLTRANPKAKLPRGVNKIYPQSIHKSGHGEWDFNLNWKPIEGFTTYFKWAIAIVNAQNWLHQHSNISIPILCMHAAKSSKPKKYNKKAKSTDTVLQVKHMKKLSPKLGNQVTVLAIKGGLHDLFLSAQPVRKKAFSGMFDWLAKVG